jgi:predicted transcriptional regulator
MRERVRRLAVLDALIERAMADMNAGNVIPSEDVFAKLEAELKSLPDRTAV